MLNRSCRAFTLIELLVVVVVLAVLTAIAIPVLQDAVVRAKLALAYSNMEVILNAVEVYNLDNGNPTPMVFDIEYQALTHMRKTHLKFEAMTTPVVYLNDFKVLQDPFPHIPYPWWMMDNAPVSIVQYAARPFHYAYVSMKDIAIIMPDYQSKWHTWDRLTRAGLVSAGPDGYRDIMANVVPNILIGSAWTYYIGTHRRLDGQKFNQFTFYNVSNGIRSRGDLMMVNPGVSLYSGEEFRSTMTKSKFYRREKHRS